MSFDSSHADLIIQYALLLAGEEDERFDRQLGPIHLVKYVFLADLAHAKRHGGESFTGATWLFHNFGPWDVAVYERIDPATQLQILGAQVDLIVGQMLITGKNLGDTAVFDGTVTLFVPTQGEVELQQLNFDPVLQELLVALPLEIEQNPGSFLVTISDSQSVAQSFIIDVDTNSIDLDAGTTVTGSW